ncbi:MAG: hypothetical protein K2H89_09615 [Oscillospiraceae bacterium]|nr:hypothetical protein [Oscillospiraceae bacterium]
MMNEIFLERTEYERPATGESWVRSATTLYADKRLTPTAQRIYDVLQDMCTKANNIIRISLNGLKSKAFCCRKSVTNALDRLEKYGYIDKLPKAWETETNTFRVFKILPDKKRSKSKSDEQPDVMPEIQSKPRKPRAEKPEKKKYGEYGRVRLTDEEYNSLLNDFGQKITIRYIQRADDYSQEHKRYYNNNAETIRKWIETDRDNPNRNYRGKDKNKDNVITDEEMAGYLRLVNRFRDDDIPASEPVSEPEPEEYEMTDEEIAQILDCWDTDKIYDTYYCDNSHPLCHCSVGELMEMAKRQREQRDTS